MLRKEADATDPKLLEDVEVSFDRPSDGFAPTQATIDLFLYDLREDAELRSNEPDMAYEGKGTVRRGRPPLRVDCSYLLTAWPAPGHANAALEEQRLLGEAVQILARHETIPADYRQGPVKTMVPPPTLRVAVGAAERGLGLAEFWSALGSKLRPSVLLRVTAAINATPVPAAGPDFLTTSVGLTVRPADPANPPPSPTSPAPAGPFFPVAGRVTTGGRAAAGAVVRLVGLPADAKADENGVFRFGALPPGTYDAVAEATTDDGGATTRRKSFQVVVPVGPGGLKTVDLLT